MVIQQGRLPSRTATHSVRLMIISFFSSLRPTSSPIAHLHIETDSAVRFNVRFRFNVSRVTSQRERAHSRESSKAPLVHAPLCFGSVESCAWVGGMTSSQVRSLCSLDDTACARLPRQADDRFSLQFRIALSMLLQMIISSLCSSGMQRLRRWSPNDSSDMTPGCPHFPDCGNMDYTNTLIPTKG